MSTLVKDYERNMVLSTIEYDVIGTRPVRHDGADKVTGRALYGADLKLTGLLYGAILRSPHAHARIKSIDTSKAEALDGVKAVLTFKDLPDAGDKIVDVGEGDTRLKYVRDNVLASDKALYAGHAVADVAATSIHIAEEAAGLIQVEYEPLPPVLTGSMTAGAGTFSRTFVRFDPMPSHLAEQHRKAAASH
jgi:CO/xanthine dehydrogenase Mo-binding subunit